MKNKIKVTVRNPNIPDSQKVLFHPVYHYDPRMQNLIMEIVEKIETTGFYIAHVRDKKKRIPNFAYTIGLTLKNLPEVIVFSLDDVSSMDTLTTVYYRMLKREFKIGESYTKIFEERLGKFARIHPTQLDPYFNLANLVLETVYDKKIITMPWQLFWPDPQGRWVWETEADGKNFQPRLDIEVKGKQK